MIWYAVKQCSARIRIPHEVGSRTKESPHHDAIQLYPTLFPPAEQCVRVQEVIHKSIVHPST